MTVTPKKKAGPSSRATAQVLTPEQIGEKRFYQAARAFGQGRSPEKNLTRLRRLRNFVGDDYKAVAQRKCGVELPDIVFEESPARVIEIVNPEVFTVEPTTPIHADNEDNTMSTPGFDGH